MQYCHQLSKPQRALRAYLNYEKPPLGFKGRPCLFDNGVSIEWGLTPFHLSRYAYVQSVLLYAVTNLVYFDLTQDPRNSTIPLDRISQETFSEYLQAMPIITSAFQFLTERARNLPLMLMPLFVLQPSESVLQKANDIYAETMRAEFACLPLQALVDSGPSGFNGFFDFARIHGALSLFLERLTMSFMRSIGKGGLAEDNLAKRIVLGYLFYRHVKAHNHFLEMNKTACNGLGRVLFTPEQTTAWRFLRPHLFSGLSLVHVKEALMRSGTDVDEETADYACKLYTLHMKYAYSGLFSFGGMEFSMEASPYAAKPVGEPAGNFELEIYPCDRHIIDAMAALANPAFEHADGAIANAAFVLGENHAPVLQEIQSDARTMAHRTPDKVSEPLKALLDKWPSLVMAAVRAFAQARGFQRLFASAPHNIFDIYHQAMHPDKISSIYFDGMERLGGRLVYDDGQTIYPYSQYYYEFEM